ncbi:nuclear transport factor 2 family protein [Nocardia sp. BMG51109]|uniref:nuclear transport factor 2 family protein n=1 Tax=Nocardia sp. BMG51109 TaxID=1056816 RepID=UPI00046473D2|nr:hypothetical protein [Nocardia sp. BMG51109]
MTVGAEPARRWTPQDPREFVAAAQRITNSRDVEAVRSIFAPDAAWTIVIDGVVLSANGIDEIVRRWQLMARFLRSRNLIVAKRLITADERTLVNEWTSGPSAMP